MCNKFVLIVVGDLMHYTHLQLLIDLFCSVGRELERNKNVESFKSYRLLIMKSSVWLMLLGMRKHILFFTWVTTLFGCRTKRLFQIV